MGYTQTLLNTLQKWKRAHRFIKVTLPIGFKVHGPIVDIWKKGICMAFLDDFHLDGYIYIPCAQLQYTSLSPSDLVAKKAMRTIGTLSKEHFHSAGKSFKALRKEDPTTVYIISSGPANDWYFCKILSMKKHHIVIRTFNDEGVRKKKTRKLQIDTINFIEWGNEYLDVYAKHIIATK